MSVASTPLDALVGAASPEASQQAATPTWSFGGRRFPAQERVNLTSQLAMMTGAGVAVSGALKSIIRQCQRPHLKQTLEQIEEEVLGGASLSSAMRRHPALFDEAYVSTVAAGEASGRMTEVLSQLAELQRAELKMQRTLRGMLVYPVLLALVSAVVITTLVIFVLPRFATIFEQYEIALPMVTQVLMGVADELRGHWYLWAPLAVGSVVALGVARATESGRRLLDTAMLRGPVIGDVTRTLIGARVCRLLGLLIESGVPLLDCLRLLRKAVSNTLFCDLTVELEDAVTNGKCLSEALDGNEVLPPSASEMIATAEKTGRLGEVSRMMGLHYEEEGQTLARQLVSVIEPLVTIVMGGVVAVVVLAVMLPVFDIATLAQR